MNTINASHLIALVEVSVAGVLTGSYKPIAGTKGMSLESARKILEKSSKSSGRWEEIKYGRGSLSGSVDAFVSFDASIINFMSLLDAQWDGEKIKFIAIVVNEADAPLADGTAILTADIDTDTFKSSTSYIIFDALIENVSEQANDDEEATFSFSFKSDGEPSIVAVPAAT